MSSRAIRIPGGNPIPEEGDWRERLEGLVSSLEAIEAERAAVEAERADLDRRSAELDLSRAQVMAELEAGGLGLKAMRSYIDMYKKGVAEGGAISVEQAASPEPGGGRIRLSPQWRRIFQTVGPNADRTFTVDDVYDAARSISYDITEHTIRNRLSLLSGQKLLERVGAGTYRMKDELFRFCSERGGGT